MLCKLRRNRMFLSHHVFIYSFLQYVIHTYSSSINDLHDSLSPPPMEAAQL